jgi:hypothetical protein
MLQVSVLDSVPDLDLLAYLPQLLDGLMNLLSDPNREIRVAAHKCMMEFLVEIQVRGTDRVCVCVCVWRQARLLEFLVSIKTGPVAAFCNLSVPARPLEAGAATPCP